MIIRIKHRGWLWSLSMCVYVKRKIYQGIRAAPTHVCCVLCVCVCVAWGMRGQFVCRLNTVEGVGPPCVELAHIHSDIKLRWRPLTLQNSACQTVATCFMFIRPELTSCLTEPQVWAAETSCGCCLHPPPHPLRTDLWSALTQQVSVLSGTSTSPPCICYSCRVTPAKLSGTTAHINLFESMLRFVPDDNAKC